MGLAVSDVIVRDDDGTHTAWTENTPCLLQRVSAATGHVGWTTGKFTATKQNGTTLVNNQLCIAVDRKIIATLTDPLMIEDWAFLDEGKTVVVKSRGFHGPANLYRAIIATGKVTASHKAVDPDLPPWARPFSDTEATPQTAADAQPHTPKIGSPERKAILDALRAEVAAEQKREAPGTVYAPAVFTPSHFKVLGNWAFVDTARKPEYGEQGVIAALQRTDGQRRVRFSSYADDVTDYAKLANKLGAPRSIFPAQGKLTE